MEAERCVALTRKMPKKIDQKNKVKEIQYTVDGDGNRGEKNASRHRPQMQAPWMKGRLERRNGWQKTRSRQVAERHWG